MALQSKTKMSTGNFTVELLGSSEDSKFGNRKFIAENNVNLPSLIHNSNIDSDVRAGLQWIVTLDSIVHPYWLSDLFMSWMSLLERLLGIWREWIPYTNMSNKSRFGSASHFANIVSWNAGSPTSNLRRLKAFFAAVIEEQSVYCNNSWRPQLRDQTLCFSAWDGSFFCSCNEGMGVIQAQCRIGGAYCGSQEPQASGRQWRLRFHKRHGFLRQTCQTNLLSAVHV